MSLGWNTATFAQIYTQNFNSFATGLGISGNNAAPCDGTQADGTVTQTLGGITWALTGSFTGGGASTEACDYVKVVQAGAGNRRLHARDLNGNEFRYRTSGVDGSTGINITGQSVTVALLVGVQAGTLEVSDEVTVQITVDGNLEYDTTFTGNFANQNISVPGLIGDELFLDVFFRNGDAGGATGEGEAHFLDNISITGTPCQPALTILGEGTPCAGSTEIYSISSPPAGHTLTWSLSSGGSITPTVDGDSATVVWNTGISGGRTITVVDFDPLTGCTTTNNRNVTLQQGPGVSPISDIGPYCPGANVNGISLNTIPFSTTATLSWTVTNPVTGFSDGSDNSFPYEFPAFVAVNTTATQQVSTVSVVATSTDGCAGTPELFTVTVNPAPDLVLNGDPTICSGETFDLGTLINSNLVDGEVVDQNNIPSLGFLVYTSTNFIPANQLLNLMVSPASTTPYYFVKPTLAGCNDSIGVVLTVQGPISINSSTGDQEICAGDDAIFSVSAGNLGDGDLIYQWQVSDDGMSWTDITDDATYSGATTNQLTISDATVALDGKFYHVLVSTSECAALTSTSAELTVKPRPALETVINGVTVTDNNDGVDDTGSFSVCDGVSPNLFFTSFTDLAGASPAGQVKVIQEFLETNVIFGPTDGVFPLSVFSPAFTGTVSLIDPTQNGTLVMRFRAFFDNNNDDILDAGDCPGDWIVYTVTVGEIPSVSATADLLQGGGIYAACSGEEFTITIDGTGNPVGTTYSADWALSALFGAPDLMLIDGTGDFDNKPTTASTSTTLTGSFVNPQPNVNSVQVDITITATTPEGCTETYLLTIHLRPEIGVSSVTGLPATVCSGEMTPVGTVNLNIAGGTRSITWEWSGIDITAVPPTGGPDGSSPFNILATTLNNTSPDPATATLTVTPALSYTDPVVQVCPGEGFEVDVEVSPGPVVDDIVTMACSDEPIEVVLGASTNLVPVYTYNITVSNNGGLTASSGPTTGPTLNPNAIFNDAWTNTTGSAEEVMYTITPISVDGCVGPDFTVTITIKAEPVVPFQSGDMACSDELIGIILGNGDPFVSAFNITAIDDNGLTASAGNPTTGTGFTDNEIEDDAWTNTGNSPVNVIYTVIPVSLEGCEGDFFTVTVMIKPEPVVADQEVFVCSDEDTGVIFGDDVDGPAAASYTITALSVDPGLTADPGNVDLSGLPLDSMSADTLQGDSYTNLTNDSLTVVYTVVPVSADGCKGDPFTVTVTVKPEPVVADLTGSVCSDEAIGTVLPGLDDDGLEIDSFDISATVDPLLSGSATSGVGITDTLAISTDVFTNTTNDPHDVVYLVVPYTEGCPGDTFSITITILPEPVVSDTSAVVCSGEAVGMQLPATDDDGLALTSFDISASVEMGLSGAASQGTGITSLDTLAADVFVNLTNDSLDVVYTVIPYSGDCEGAPFDITITVKPEPVVADLTSMVCSDEAIGVTLPGTDDDGLEIDSFDISAVVHDSLSGMATTGAGITNTGAIAMDAFTNTSNAAYDVVYTVTPYTKGCAGEPFTITMTIKPEPVVENQEGMACSDVATGIILGNDANGPAAATYNIIDINPNGLTASAGSPANGIGLSANVIADDAWSNLTNASVSVVYTVVPVSADGCQGDAFTVTVLIKPEPSVLFQEIMVCSDEPLDLLLGDDPDGPSVAFYNITNINPNGLTPGFGNATTGPAQPQSAIADDTWTNITTGTVNVIYTVIPTGSNGCVGEAFAVTVMVKPEPEVDDQTAMVCSDEEIGVTLGDDIDGPAAATYEIVALTVDPGLTPDPGNLDLSSLPVLGLTNSAIFSDSYTNLTNGPLTVVYTVIPVSADGCGGDPFTVTVTIKPEPVVADITDGTCSDEAIGTPIPGTDDDGLDITSFDISAVADPMLVGSPSTGMALTDTTHIAGDVFTNTTNGPLDVVYTVTPYADGCAGASYEITVTISPEPVVANVPTFNVCSDEPIGYVLPATDDDGLAITSFDISASVHPDLTGTATTGTGITDVNAIANDSYTNLTGGGRTVVYTITPYSNGCAGASFTVTVNVRAEPVLDPNLDAMVCSDEPVGVILDIDNTIGFQTVTGYDIIAITPDPGLTGDPGNAVTGNNQADNAIAGDIWTNTTSGILNVIYSVAPRRNNGCVGDTVDITVMIKPEPVVDDQTEGPVCSDQPIGVILGDDVDGPAAASYNITAINPNGLTQSAGLQTVPGTGYSNNILADDAWTNAGNTSVNVIYTIVPVSADGCEGDPFTVTVTIQPEPVVAFQTLTVCSDEVLGLTLGNDPNGPSVAFYDITGINPNGLMASAGNPVTGMGLLANEIADDAWTNTTNAPVDVIYALIPYGSNGCPGNPFAVTVTVNPEPVVDDQTGMVCSDEPTGITLGNDGDGPTAVEYNITGIDSSGLTSSAGAPAVADGVSDSEIADDAWTNTTNAPVDVVYTVVPVSAEGCEGDPFTVTMTIKPEPVVDDQTAGVCSDEPTGVTLGNDGDGPAAVTYNITAIDSSGLLPSAGNPAVANMVTDAEIADDAWTNPGITPVDVVYTVVPVSADGCEGDPFMVTVTISAEPVLNDTMTMVCSDVATGFILADDPDGPAVTSYTIAEIDSSGLMSSAGAPATGTGFDNSVIADDAWTNTTSNPVDVVYYVVPLSGGCEGDTIKVTVTVKPEPVVDDQTSMACSDVAIGVTLGASTSVAAATYNITDIDSNGLTASAGAPATGNGVSDSEIADDAWTNTTNAPVDVVYTVVPVSADGCEGDPFTVTVTIKPEPVVEDQTGVVCSDAPTGITLGNDVDGPSAATYNITAINPNGLSASAGSPATGNGLAANEIANDAWTNATNASVDVIYTVVPVSADGCEGDPFTVTVTIQPEPVVAFQTLTVCSDEVLGLILGNDPNGPSVAFYDITNINPNGLMASAGSPSTGVALPNNVIADDAWTNETNSPVDVIYTIIPYGSNGCPGNPFAVTITVNPEPVVDDQTDMACSDEAISVTLGASTSVPAADYNIVDIDSSGLVSSAGAPAVADGVSDSEIADDAWTNTTNAPVDVVYTVVPVSADGCEGDPFTVTVTIKPEPVVDDQTAGVCSDEPTGVTLGNDGDGPAAVTYNITEIDSSGLLPSAGNPAVANMVTDAEIADDAWTNPGITPVDVVYTVVPVSGDGCEGDPFTVTVTISAEPVLNDTMTMVCSDVATGFILADDPDGPAVTSYTIAEIDSSGLTSSAGAPATGTGFDNSVIADDAWTNTTSNPVDVVYYVVPLSGGCEGDTIKVTVTIKPEPVVDDQTSMACSDVALGVTLGASTSVPAATYSITDINSNGLTASAGGPITGTGFADNEIADHAWTNTTNAPVDVIYTVVPVSADGCEGDPFTVTVTIKPEPVVANQAQSICSDVPNGLILGASTSVPAATYNITNIQNNGLLASAGAPMTGNGFSANVVADDAWTNQGISPVNVVYTVVPVSADGCEGNAFTVTITVAPEPVLDVPGAPVTVCSDSPLSSEWGGITTINGQVLSYINLTDVTDNTASPNFTPDPGNAAFPAGAVPVNYFDNDSYTNLTMGGVIVSYDVVAVTTGGCASDPVTYEFQIRAEPVLNPDLDTTVCSGNPVGVVFSLDPTLGFQTVTGYDILAITPDAGLTGGGPAAVGNNQPANAIAGDVWNNPTNGPLNVVYTVVPRRGGGPCLGDPVDITVTIEPYPVAALALDAGGSQDTLSAGNSPYMLMVCSDEPFSAQAISDVVPTPGRDLWLEVQVSDPDNVLGNGVSFTFLAPYGTVAFNNSIHNETNAPFMITATFTPFINFDGDQTLDPEECVGDPFELQVVIKPEPVAQATPSATEVCDDEPFTIDLDDNGSSVPASFFDIFIEIPVGLTQTGGTTSGSSLAGPTNTISGEFSNNTTGTLTVTYFIIPLSTDGCAGDTLTVEIDIFARPSTDPGPDMICKGTTATIMPNVTLGSAAISSYKWTYLGTTASNFRINGGPLLNPGSPTGTMYTTTNLSINTTSPLVIVGLIGFELVVTDANGCTSEPVEVYIEIKPVPNAGTNGSFGPICETFGNINLFSLLGGTPEPGGTWTANMGNPAGGTLVGPNFNPAGSVGGVYTFTYTIDNGACPPVSSTVTVTVNPNANAGTFDIGADNDVCEDETNFNLFTLLTGTAGVNYDAGGTWAELTSSGAGLNASTGELDLTTAVPGNYTFRYTVTVGPTACPDPTDFEEVTLNILELPAPNPILGNAESCVGTSANYALTTPVVVGATRAWSISGGGTITSGTTGDNISVDWGNVPGTYTVTCVETRLGCSTTNELEVTVEDTEAGFTYSVGSMDGLTFNFTDTSTGNATVWFWNFGDGFTSPDQNPTHIYDASGTYTVCLEVTGDCGTDTYCEDIEVVFNPPFVCDTIILDAGLNLISTDVIPADNMITTVFGDIIGASNLLFIQGRNSSGSVVIFDPSLPPFLNTLTQITPGEGYFVRVIVADTLVVCGTPIDPNFKKDLNAGINLVAYVPQASSTPAVYFADLITASNLLFARGYDGGFKIFDPTLPPFLNTLTSVDNGFGYEIRVINPVLGVDWLTGIEEGMGANRTLLGTYGNPNSLNYDVVAGRSNLPPSAVGKLVYLVSETGEILGAMEVLAGGYLMTTPVYGNDLTLDVSSDLYPGDRILIQYEGQIIDPGLTFYGDKRITMLDIEFTESLVLDVKEQEILVTDLKVFPNPFQNQLNLSFRLKKGAAVSIQLLNIYGQVMELIQPQAFLLEGTHVLDWDGNRIPSGTYFIQFSLDGAPTVRYPVIRQD